MAIHSSEFLEKKRKRLRKRSVIFSAIVVLLLGGSVYLSHLDAMRIDQVQVLGNSVTRDEEIEKVVLESLAGKYLMIFPRDNSLIYPQDQIESNLLSEIPRLSAVEFNTGQGVLGVRVEEREAHALYCHNITSLSDPDGCYFIDKDGFIFSPAPSFSGDVYFLYSRDERLPEPLGKQFIPKEEFRSLTQFIEGLETLGVETRALEVKSAIGEYHLVLPNSGRIMWKSKEQFDKIARNLESFLLDEEVARETSFIDRVLYLDLRYENRVFYKFQDSDESR